MTKPKTKNAGRYHHGDLRSALIAAASGIVEREGVMALSLRGVAREAGVSQTAPYHHFSDKQALLASVAETGFQDLVDNLCAKSAGVSDSGEMLVALGQGYVDFAMANPGRFRLMFGPLIRDKLNHSALLDGSVKSFDMIRAAVRSRRVEIGAVTSNDEADTMAAWSLVHGLATLLTEFDFNPETMGAGTQTELAGQLVRTLVNGLGRG